MEGLCPPLIWTWSLENTSSGTKINVLLHAPFMLASHSNKLSSGLGGDTITDKKTVSTSPQGLWVGRGCNTCALAHPIRVSKSLIKFGWIRF